MFCIPIFFLNHGFNVFKNAKNDLEAVVEKMSKLLVIKSYIFFTFSSILLGLKSIFFICYDNFLHTQFFPLTPSSIFYTLLLLKRFAKSNLFIVTVQICTFSKVFLSVCCFSTWCSCSQELRKQITYTQVGKTFFLS